MKYGLMDIKDQVEPLVACLHGLLAVEICIVDHRFGVIACTPGFHARKGGRDRSEFLRPLLNRTEPSVVDQPGEHQLCQGCSQQASCVHTVEIDIPIRGRNSGIGVLSVVGFSTEDRRRILGYGDELLLFLGQVCNLLGRCLSVAESGRARESPDAPASALRNGSASPGPPEEEPVPLQRIVGKAPAILAAKNKAQRVAASPATVLLTGESGAGKELFALAIHELSPRRSGRFVAINCAAIPENLLESELFGYEEGAFTGARTRGKPGKLEQAQGGTLLLDEIGDMPPALQAKLLRVLQERSVDRVGGTSPVRLDVRVISATNQPLEQMIRKGHFRADLYYRLAVVPIHIPALRERVGDVAVLARHLLVEICRRAGRSPMTWSAEALAALDRHHWPGNVRELVNTVEYVVHMCTSPLIRAGDLPPSVEKSEVHPPAEHQGSLASQRDAAERAALNKIFADESVADVTAAARALGISRASLYRKMRKHGLG